MNENAKKWVEKLRDPSLKQGRMVLGQDDRRCCLGVACDLAVEAGVCQVLRIKADGVIIYGPGDTASLPTVVRNWLGLRHVGGEYFEGGSVRYLSGWNDNGVSFSEIADIIESEPEGLFEAQS
jgi:hypothetical protein